MQEEAMSSLAINGEGTCRHFVTGHWFTLERHFNADGLYLLTAVEHSASLGANYRSGADVELRYANRFRCLPRSALREAMARRCSCWR